MLLLALDTATPAVTAALHDGETVVASYAEVDARRHGELLLPAVDRVLADAGTTLRSVTAIVVGTGPGPYTGLRVGLMTADTFGLALGLPVHGLCTLDGLAYASGLDGPFAVATDARRKEVYWARYADPRTRLTEPSVDRPADIADELAGLPVVGAGPRLYPDAFPDGRGPEHADAGALASLAAERLRAGCGACAPGRCICAGRTRRSPRTTRWSPPVTAVLREMRWWDIDAVLDLERALFPDDAWSRGMFWSELAHSRGPAPPGGTSSPRTGTVSSATRDSPPPVARTPRAARTPSRAWGPSGTCRRSPSPGTTGAPASARCSSRTC